MKGCAYHGCIIYVPKYVHMYILYIVLISTMSISVYFKSVCHICIHERLLLILTGPLRRCQSDLHTTESICQDPFSIYGLYLAQRRWKTGPSDGQAQRPTANKTCIVSSWVWKNFYVSFYLYHNSLWIFYNSFVDVLYDSVNGYWIIVQLS